MVGCENSHSTVGVKDSWSHGHLLLSQYVPIIVGTVEFFNEMDDDATLTLLEKNCSCVDITADGVELDLKSDFGVAAYGTKSLQIMTGVPRRAGKFGVFANFEAKSQEITLPPITIRRVFEIHDDLAVEPSLFRFGRDDVRFTATVYTTTLNDVTKLRIVDSPDFVSSSLRLVATDQLAPNLVKQTWQLIVNIDPLQSPVKSSSFQIESVDDEDKAIVAKTIVLLGETPNLVYPKLVGFGNVNVGDEHNRVIKVIARNRKPFKIINAMCDCDAFNLVSQRAVSPGMRHIEVRFAPKQKGRMECTLDFDTDQENPRHVNVQLTGFSS
jgi:hypothetical protein